MRTANIVLGVFGGLILGQQVYIPIQLRLLSGGGTLRPDETVLIALFVCWAIATALIQRLPGVAVWLFSAGGVAGILLGARFDEPSLTVWGVLANGLALLAVLAHREWRQDERAQRARDQHLAAIAAAVLTPAPSLPATPDPDGSNPTLRPSAGSHPHSSNTSVAGISLPVGPRTASHPNPAT